MGVKSLVHYQKPLIGSSSNTSKAAPVHVIFPSGSFSIGIPWKDDGGDQQSPRERGLQHSVLASGPDESNNDQLSFRGLQIAFCILGLLNIVITTYLFFRADAIDYSKVEIRLRSMPQVFGSTASERRAVEVVHYAFALILIVLGCVSVLMWNVLGISAYCLSIILNYVLGTSSLPYCMYSFRYLFDLVMLYVGLVIRSRLMVTFLPLPAQSAAHRNERNRWHASSSLFCPVQCYNNVCIILSMEVNLIWKKDKEKRKLFLDNYY